MPFRHPNRAHDLDTRLGHEVRERLEEAIDFVCLDALVRTRQARGLPPPQADNAADRAPRLAAGDEQERLLGSQVARARTLPDYWQRFEALSARFLAEPASSSGERRGVLARLFGRG